MKQIIKKVAKPFKKGDYSIVLEKAQRKNPNISYDNVLAYFNSRVVAEEKGKQILIAAKSVYKKRTGKKFAEG